MDESTPEPVKAMVKILEDYAWEHRNPGSMPEGICLEMHPTTRRLVMLHWAPSFAAHSSGRDTPFPVTIPVRINPELPPGSWRLAVITVETIQGGVLS